MSSRSKKENLADALRDQLERSLIPSLQEWREGLSESDQGLFDRVNAAGGDTSVLTKNEARRFKRIQGKGVGRALKSMERNIQVPEWNAKMRRDPS